MTKRIISVLLIIVSIFMLTSCKKAEETAASTTEKAASAKIDYDTSSMNFTTLSAFTQQMQQSPEEYLGKTFKIKGAYGSSYYEETKSYYHYIIGTDTTACCNWNVEFKLDETKMKYPADKANIEITGTYDTYTELNVKYYYIKVDTIKTV